MALAQAFHAALCSISNQEDESEPSQFKVEGKEFYYENVNY